jgi:hypothetical protein
VPGPDGVSMFRTNEIRVGSGAPFTPGHGAHTADENASAAAVAPPRLALHSGPSPVFRSSE